MLNLWFVESGAFNGVTDDASGCICTFRFHPPTWRIRDLIVILHSSFWTLIHDCSPRTYASLCIILLHVVAIFLLIRIALSFISHWTLHIHFEMIIKSLVRFPRVFQLYYIRYIFCNTYCIYAVELHLFETKSIPD